MTNWKKWFIGLIAATVSSAAQAVVVAVSAYTVAPDLLHDSKFWEVMAIVIGFNAIKAAAAYLAKSPIPGIVQVTS